MSSGTTPRRALISTLVRYSLLAVASLFAILPVYWAVNTSLKPEGQIVSFPPQWFPDTVTLGHYASVLTHSSLPRNYFNSTVIAIGTVTLVLVVAVHAAYAAARYDFRGKDAALFLLLSTVMVPGIVTLIPLYVLTVQLGLHNTFIAMILIFAAWQTPLAVWILKAFFEGIPKELDEAALVDGCSRLGAFYRVVLPLSLPGLAAAAIIIFVWVWNEFIIALTLTADNSARPLTVGLYLFVGESGVEWGRITAAACAALLPVLVVYVALQRRFIEGLTAGGTKG